MKTKARRIQIYLAAPFDMIAFVSIIVWFFPRYVRPLGI